KGLPKDGYYNSPDHAEEAYLWRWIGMHAPDVVLEIRDAPDGPPEETKPPAADEFIRLLQTTPPCDVGTMHAAGAMAVGRSITEASWLAMLATQLNVSGLHGGDLRSPARKELLRRLDRSPRQVADELAVVYGHKLDQVAYIPALPLVAKLRLTELTGDSAPCD